MIRSKQQRRRMGQKNRSLLNHGPGKGCVDRTDDIKSFKANFAAIDFTKELPSDGISEVLVNTPKRFVKRYGAAEPVKVPGLAKIIVH